MSTQSDQEAAATVLWHYTGREFPEAIPSGGFYGALILAIAKADPINKNQLAMAYPTHVAFAILIEHVPDGVEVLRKVARSEVETEAAIQIVRALILAETEASERG